MPLDDLFDRMQRQQREIENLNKRYAKTTDFPYRTDPDIMDMKQMDLRELQIKHQIENDLAQKRLGEDNIIKKNW